MTASPALIVAGLRAFCRARPAGASLVELLVAVGVVAVLAGAAAPGLTSGRDEVRLAGAASYLAVLVQQTRSEAVTRGETVALQFGGNGAVPSCARFLDGNRNGVRTAEIARGVDVPLGSPVRLADHFPGVEFGLVPGVTDIETGAPLAGSGIRLGAGGLLSFAATGSSTSGTVYLRGPGRRQYAIRVLGATGRVRVLRFDDERRRWVVP